MSSRFAIRSSRPKHLVRLQFAILLSALWTVANGWCDLHAGWQSRLASREVNGVSSFSYQHAGDELLVHAYAEYKEMIGLTWVAKLTVKFYDEATNLLLGSGYDPAFVQPFAVAPMEVWAAINVPAASVGHTIWAEVIHELDGDVHYIDPYGFWWV